MDPKANMLELISGKCEAVKESERFLNDWFYTKSKPCSICGKDKSECEFYKELVRRAAIDEKGKSS